MHSKKIFILGAITAIALSLTGCISDPTEVNWEEEFFGKETYAELQMGVSFSDRKAVQPVLDFADEAFSFIVATDEDKKEAEEKFGKLHTYCLTNDDVVSEAHAIDFLSAKTDGNNGYLWVHYYREGYDKNGDCTCGAWGIKSRWTIKKIDGEWVVTDILEHP